MPDGPRRALPPIRAGRKTIRAWLVQGDLDPATITSNSFEMEWPPRSGRHQSFPEVDRAEWFDLEDAASRVHKGQLPLLTAIAEALADT